MMQQRLNSIPEITKNLIIINLLMFLATIALGDWFYSTFRVYYVENDNFQPFQLITAFFMHSNQGISHLFFNMFSLFMFGSEVERTLGPKRFLFLYLSAGFGANLLNLGVDYAQVQQLISVLSPEQIMAAKEFTSIDKNLITADLKTFAQIWHGSALGASGATYGILFTFAVLYPNRVLYLLIPPMPVKAKYLVIGLALMEFYFHMSAAQTGIGHFVHLSGALIAVGIVLIWRKQGARF